MVNLWFVYGYYMDCNDKYMINIHIWVNYNALTATEPWESGFIQRESSPNGLIQVSEIVQSTCPGLFLICKFYKTLQLVRYSSIYPPSTHALAHTFPINPKP